MEYVEQVFNPSLKSCLKNSENTSFIASRKWCINSKDERFSSESEDNIPYIGEKQIEEVWKHYWKGYYISNYGYVVKIDSEDEKFIPKTLKNADENSQGMSWLDFTDELKNLFRKNAFVPKNRTDSGCKICLNITGNTAEYDIHRLVARFFLQTPVDFDEKKYIVHHIDNNSYNNSVTNLIYLPADSHIGKQHKIYHPMSHK